MSPNAGLANIFKYLLQKDEGSQGRRLGIPNLTSYVGDEDDLPIFGQIFPGRPGSLKEGHMAWIYLVCAGFLEIVWAYAMKQSEGFTRLTPSVVTLVAMIASFGLLSLSMRTLPLGTAYVIWTGIGAVGAFIVGAAVLGEPLGLTRVVAAVLIISGLILMKIATPS